MTATADFYAASSYGAFGISSWDTTDVLRLPHPSTEYCGEQALWDLRDDAQAIATAAGHLPDAYDIRAYAFPELSCHSFRRIATLGGGDMWLNGYFYWMSVASGIGHNLGLLNAHSWYRDEGGADHVNENGDPYDLMGFNRQEPIEVNAAAKALLGWIPSAEIEAITTSGTYRVYDLRKPVGPGLSRALTVEMGPYGYTHWLDFRPSDLGQGFYDHAVTVRWVDPADPADIYLVDTAPGTSSRDDASLRVGTTYSDPANAVHLTPIGRGGADPDYMDVVVNIGPFPNNHPPTATLSADPPVGVPDVPAQFTAVAEDADGDPLAYAWTINDPLYHNSPTLAHTFSSPGVYPVAVAVSDMKGGTAFATLDYEVQSPAPIIDVAPGSFDFGEVELWTPSSTTFTVLNAGSADLTVHGIELAPANANFSLSATPGVPTTIAPFDSIEIEITYRPTAEGSAATYLHIHSNDSNQPTVYVELNGTGTAPADPHTAVLSDLHRNTITGKSSVFYVVNTAAESADYALDYFWPNGEFVGTDNRSLPPGAALVVDMAVDVPFAENPFYGVVRISTDQAMIAGMCPEEAICPETPVQNLAAVDGVVVGSWPPTPITIDGVSLIRRSTGFLAGSTYVMADGRFYIGGLDIGEQYELFAQGGVGWVDQWHPAWITAPDSVIVEMQSPDWLVNKADDLDDGVCDAAHCSLREAINSANADEVSHDRVFFSVPDGPIAPTSALPEITGPVDLTGTVHLDGSLAGPGSDGLVIASSHGTIRGLTITRFDGNGLRVTGGGNIVIDNHIGTDAAGTSGLGNTNGLVLSEGAKLNRIGGNEPADRNVVSGNIDSGIAVVGAGTSSNEILGNYIGTDPSGTSAVPNLDGIWLGGGATGNGIANNLISGNHLFGVSINDVGTSNNGVYGNLIGTDVAATSAIANGAGGIVLTMAAGPNSIGGPGAAAANTISYNRGPGIKTHADAGVGNQFSGNSVHSNDGLGIDLNDDGVTANDPLDSDSGPNGLQNYPTLTSIVPGSGGTTVTGSLNSAPMTDFRVEFFQSAVCDPSGYGEGETYLAALNVTTDTVGNADFGGTLGVLVPSDEFISATATDPDGNTSEFSKCSRRVPVEASGDPYPARGGDTVALAAAANPGSGADYRWVQTAGPPVPLTGDDEATAEFMAPDVAQTIALTFRVEVTDDEGGLGSDDLVVNVIPADSPTTTGEMTSWVPPGETVTEAIQIPAYTHTATLSTNWPGSDVETTLVSPSGDRINRGSVPVGVGHELGATYESFTVPNPEPGLWQLELFGADVPADGEEVSLQSILVAADIDAQIDVKARAIRWEVDDDGVEGVSPRRLKVYLFGSDALSVADVHLAALALGDPDLAATVGPIKAQVRDKNADGYHDLVLTFRAKQLIKRNAIDQDTKVLRLTATTYTGARIAGEDTVRTRVKRD